MRSHRSLSLGIAAAVGIGCSSTSGLVSNGGTSGNTASGTGTTFATGAASSSGGVSGASTGHANSSSTGRSHTAATSSSTTTSGSSSSTGGTTACCSAACCSEPSTPTSTSREGELHCQDGSSCYGGWYCAELADGSGSCSQNDPCNGQSGVWSCGSSMSSGTTTTATTGSSGTAGGQVNVSVASLSFGVIGDTRPSNTCTSTPCGAYPTAVIDALYSGLTSYSPQVGFIVATGDYQYNTPGDGTSAWQIGQYLAATNTFTASGRRVFPTMGNHECTGYTDSECGGAPGGSGATENYTAFLDDLLAPLNIPNANPYYAVRVTVADGTTAKFLMVTPNAWDSAQQSWLTTALTQPTTYTFIVQHESNNLDELGTSAPSSLSTIRSVVQASGTPANGQTYPVTLWLVGHTHNYDYDATNQQMILGLGGAPADSLESGESSSTFFTGNQGAYAVCTEQTSGSPPAIQCTLIDGSSNAAAGQSFAVNADGSTAAVQ